MGSHKNRISIFILCFVFLSPFLKGQASLNKSGGICFRFDDNLPQDQLAQVAAIFNKYNVKYCLALNLAAPPDAATYIPFIQNLERDGFEIMDHCPNHCTNVFWTDALFLYKNRKGVDHLNIPSNMVCLKYEKPERNKLLPRGFVKAARNIIVSGTKGEFKNWNDATQFLYFPTLNLIVNPEIVKNSDRDNRDTMHLRNFWGEQLDLGNIDKLEYYIIDNSDVRMTEDARALLASESLRLFRKYKLQRPVTWVQPGAKTPQFSPREIKKTFGDRYHYTSAGSNGGLQCYNDAIAEARFAMQWGDFSAGVDIVSSDKNKIADQIAKHHFLIGGNHFWDVPIEWGLYLSRIDSLLSWCQQKRIPVRTYRQWAKLVYDTPQDPYTNIFPNLHVDLDENGIPDGYDLKNGQLDKNDGAAANGYSLAVQKKGVICEIKDLAGLEKGENEFFIYTKGAPGNFITVDIRFQEDQNTLVTYKFPAESKTWVCYSLRESLLANKTLFAPANYSYANITISCSDYKGGKVKIAGMQLNRKFSDSLFIISKPDTFVSLDKRYEYQVIAAQYFTKDRLFYELVNSPAWLKIDSQGLISGIPTSFTRALPVTIQVKDQSGNITKQSYRLTLKNIDHSKGKLINLILYFLHTLLIFT